MTPTHKDLDGLRSSRLLDETEQPLKCLGDYRKAIEGVIATYPALRSYLTAYLLPSIGDFPTFFFQKKLVAQVTECRFF